MLRRSLFALTFTAALAAHGLAQNTNSGATATDAPRQRARTTTTPARKGATAAPTSATTDATGATVRQDTGAAPATPAASATTRKGGAASQTAAKRGGETAAALAVRDAFDTLIAAVRRADAEAVMGLYLNSPQLLLFNNNGTVTRGWEQAHANRVSLYKEVKDVKLDVRDVRVQMTGPTAAVVTYLWSQSQTAGGAPESATGRTTLVFQQVKGAWKAVHAHVSPDKPSPSLVLPSERTTLPEPAEPPTAPAQPPANR